VFHLWQAGSFCAWMPRSLERSVTIGTMKGGHVFWCCWRALFYLNWILTCPCPAPLIIYFPWLLIKLIKFQIYASRVVCYLHIIYYLSVHYKQHNWPIDFYVEKYTKVK
jgi:hypothetical protein